MRLMPRSIMLALSVGAEHRHAPSMDSAYWLAHCDGFRVDGPGGQIGVVDHVEYGPQTDMPAALSVASGLWRIHYTRLPITDVADVRPEEERIVVGRPEAREEFGVDRPGTLDVIDAQSAPHRPGSDHRCVDCGYGVTVTRQQLRCPMCGATTWEGTTTGGRTDPEGEARSGQRRA